MQNQVNANRERVNPVTMATPFIFTSGEVVNLASLVSSANTKTTSGNTLIPWHYFRLKMKTPGFPIK